MGFVGLEDHSGSFGSDAAAASLGDVHVGAGDGVNVMDEVGVHLFSGHGGVVARCVARAYTPQILPFPRF